MSDRQRSRFRQVTGLIERHRNRLLAAVAVVMVYALLGFLVAPWLVKKNAIESEELRAGHTTLTEAAEDEELQEQFDALAYTNDLASG